MTGRDSYLWNSGLIVVPVVIVIRVGSLGGIGVSVVIVVVGTGGGGGLSSHVVVVVRVVGLVLSRPLVVIF